MISTHIKDTNAEAQGRWGRKIVNTIAWKNIKLIWHIIIKRRKPMKEEMERQIDTMGPGRKCTLVWLVNCFRKNKMETCRKWLKIDKIAQHGCQGPAIWHNTVEEEPIVCDKKNPQWARQKNNWWWLMKFLTGYCCLIQAGQAWQSQVLWQAPFEWLEHLYPLKYYNEKYFQHNVPK